MKDNFFFAPGGVGGTRRGRGVWNHQYWRGQCYSWEYVLGWREEASICIHRQKGRCTVFFWKALVSQCQIDLLWSHIKWMGQLDLYQPMSVAYIWKYCEMVWYARFEQSPICPSHLLSKREQIGGRLIYCYLYIQVFSAKK